VAFTGCVRFTDAIACESSFLSRRYTLPTMWTYTQRFRNAGRRTGGLFD
jgi:hypothetical protein